jgi:hypothetical protein
MKKSQKKTGFYEYLQKYTLLSVTFDKENSNLLNKIDEKNLELYNAKKNLYVVENIKYVHNFDDNPKILMKKNKFDLTQELDDRNNLWKKLRILNEESQEQQIDNVDKITWTNNNSISFKEYFEKCLPLAIRYTEKYYTTIRTAENCIKKYGATYSLEDNESRDLKEQLNAQMSAYIRNPMKYIPKAGQDFIQLKQAIFLKEEVEKIEENWKTLEKQLVGDNE